MCFTPFRRRKYNKYDHANFYTSVFFCFAFLQVEGASSKPTNFYGITYQAKNTLMGLDITGRKTCTILVDFAIKHQVWI